MPKRRVLTHTPWSVIRQLALQGVNMATIAKQFGLHVQTIRSRAWRENWQISALRKTPPTLDPSRIDDLLATADETKRLLNSLGRESRVLAATYLRDTLLKLSQLSPAGKLKNAAMFRSLIDAGSKVHGWNEAKHADSTRQIGGLHLQVLNMRPNAEVPALSDSPSGSSEQIPEAGDPLPEPESADSAESPSS